MGETFALYRKEMRAYFVSPIPYLLAGIFAAFMAWLVFFQAHFILLRQANLESLFDYLTPVLVVPASVLAMRLWSEEIRGGTLETLLAFPARVRQLVLGKFLAAWTVLGLCLLATVGLPLTAGALGDLDAGPVLTGYLGAFLLGGAYLAIGVFLSALSPNQIVAFLLAAVSCGVLWGLGAFADGLRGGPVAETLDAVTVTSHARGLARGVIDVRDVGYFASVIALFLYANVEWIENRKHA